MRLTRVKRSHAASLSVLIATTAVIGFVYFVSVPTLAQSPRPVGNEIVTHHVTLSDKITVDIEVDIDAEIKEARLWVKPHGEDKVASYRYVDFEQKERLTASGEIDVHSPSYFPPGTIFDVRFEFVSVDNDIYSSSTYVVEHLGNDHNWQRVSDDLLEIVYYGLNRRSIENLHTRVASRLPEITLRPRRHGQSPIPSRHIFPTSKNSLATDPGSAKPQPTGPISAASHTTSTTSRSCRRRPPRSSSTK